MQQYLNCHAAVLYLTPSLSKQLIGSLAHQKTACPRTVLRNGVCYSGDCRAELHVIHALIGGVHANYLLATLACESISLANEREGESGGETCTRTKPRGMKLASEGTMMHATCRHDIKHQTSQRRVPEVHEWTRVSRGIMRYDKMIIGTERMQRQHADETRFGAGFLEDCKPYASYQTR